MGLKTTDYKKQFNKETYKTAKLYLPIETYPSIDQHWRSRGYKSLNAYVNALIEKDMRENSGRVALSVSSGRKLDRLRVIARARAGEKKYQIK